MKKTAPKNQSLFDMHIEYSQAATAAEKEYRHLEGKFALAFGFLPIQVGEELFNCLSERQQQACKAFYGHKLVIESRKDMEVSRSLADAYFTAHVDRG